MIGPWQEQRLLIERVERLRAEAEQARRSRLCGAGEVRTVRRRWCVCIPKPRLLGVRHG